ncbi:SDR family NAD(P)-dependent oxidoreductase [Streptomyces phaeoluteigriseus]|uniref:SDR family NAD(P)-dependent oxidoreductase n=1 Tax=Streptomyces phaeoluteigriseus TaxID=114686 RepID=A0ABY4ZB69_9ACTN|nr:SDR family NAD(P)-dependent oxidoreductase [Streptomyces phaeoluteigriseus]USQ85935.1 SDR family NAD(P)-dependent oxidoreductase [Streptomyces phaeoluteigriseus]
MTTFALVGPGPGLGFAAARCFGKAGHCVALFSRSAQHQDNLAAELARENIHARGFTADVLDPASLTEALREAADTLAPVEILQFSPVPRGDFIRPVLDTTAADLDDPLAFSVKPSRMPDRTAFTQVSGPGRGTLLFVNGSSAVRPHPDRAGTSTAFAAESAYAAMLHTALAPEKIHAAQLVVPGAINPDSEHSSPEALAELLYGLHTDRKGFRRHAEPMPDPQDGTP